MTDRCKNVTFPASLRDAVGKNRNADSKKTALQLDKGDEEDELDLAELDEGEPDFYTQAHMPY